MTYTEHRTPSTPTRSFRIFDCVDIDAQVGDYIAEPGYPILKVVSRFDSGDYVHLVAQAGNNEPQQFDLLKPEVELAEQERNRIEADEEEFELYLASSYEDWLTEPIGSNPDAIFGKFVEPSDEEIAGYPVAANGYHDTNWTADDCEF